MKHWTPRIADAAERRDGRRRRRRRRARARAALLAPVDRRLPRAARDGARGPGRAALHRELARLEPFVDLLATRVRGTEAHVVFTAHSLPARILEEGDPYERQLRETSRLVAERAGWATGRSRTRASRRPESRGSGPDILDHLAELARARRRDVLVCPSASSRITSRSAGTSTSRRRSAARELGMTLRRIEMPNADPEFVRALALARRAGGG